MGLSTTPNPAVLDALRVAVLSDDGLTLTLAGQLDADTYRRVKKVLDVYGGKWNRKAGTHTFTTDFRPHLAHLIGGGKVGADNGGKNPLAFFPTPAPLVQSLLEMLPNLNGVRVLEPSAGTGAIADALRTAGALVDTLELDDTRHAALTAAGHTVIGRDFLAWTPTQKYPVIVMNPPFSTADDAQAYLTHIDHAWTTCLEPGGVLAAIAPVGFTYRADLRPTTLRLRVQQFGSHVYNDKNAFAASGTAVHTATLIIRKPAQETAMPAPAPKKASRSSKKPAPAASAAPWQAGDCIMCRPNGTTVIGAVLEVNAHLATVQYRNGTLALPLTDIVGADDYPPMLALQAGDRVRLDRQPGRTYQVMATAELHAEVQLMDVDSGSELAVAARHLRVARRVDPQHLLVDLGFTPVPEQLVTVKAKRRQPAPAEDLPFPVTEAELDAAIPEPTPDYEALFPVGSRVLVDDGTTGTVRSHYHDPEGEHVEGVRADGCIVTPDGWDGTPEALHDVAHVQLTAAPELPGTPVLISPADLAPGTLGLHLVPLHQTTRSACNVRNHYDPAAIEELAASIKAEGQIENATGRWTADGQVEIVAGESRRRAQLLRADQGETGLTLMVNIRELADVEALRISATENMRRRKMTPLEECEAMLRMQQAGALMEDLTTTFGYKTAQPVADRILVAQTLHTTGRELLDRGELSLAQAMVIARAPGQDLQLSMIRDATSSWNRATAETLSKRLSQGQFLVKHAKFDAEKSELEVKRDLFDAFEPFFLDKAAALNAQTKWLEAKAERLRAKGKHAFVHVITEANFNKWGSRGPYTHSGSKGTAGLVFALNPETGAVTEESDVYLRANASSSGEKASTARQISDSAYQEAHQLRAHALRDSMAGNTHATLALTVWGIVLGAQPGEGRVKVAELTGLPRAGEFGKFMPQLDARTTALQAVIAPAAAKRSHYRANPTVLLELLLAMTDAELLEHLNTLVSATAYDWSIYSNRAEVRPEYGLLASLTDAPQRLAKSFKLTDEWLKKYPRPDLVALAEEAGLGRALVEDCGTLKEMRARLLEHADSLHAAGFVPRLVQFPAPPAPTIKAAAAPQDSAEPERARALAALAQIHDGQLSYLLDASGHDHTDWDTHAEMREWAQSQINTIGEQACADWTVLHELAADATSHGTLTADLPEHPTTAAD